MQHIFSGNGKMIVYNGKMIVNSRLDNHCHVTEHTTVISPAFTYECVVSFAYKSQRIFFVDLANTSLFVSCSQFSDICDSCCWDDNTANQIKSQSL